MTEDGDGMVLRRRRKWRYDGIAGKAPGLERHTLPTVAGTSVLRVLGSRAVAAAN